MMPEMSRDHKEQESRPRIDGKMVTQHYAAVKSLAALAFRVLYLKDYHEGPDYQKTRLLATI